jgi:hypothetical protein
MMIRMLSRLLLPCVLIGSSAPVAAFEYSGDQTAKMMIDMVARFRNKTICPPPHATVKDASVAMIASPKGVQKDFFPTDCAAQGFYADGDFRSFDVYNVPICPAIVAKDFEAVRAAPKTIGWAVTPQGQLTITRPNATEVWNAYIVDERFDRADAPYEKGDLLMYLAKYNDIAGEHVGTLYFRHFHRLAD